MYVDRTPADANCSRPLQDEEATVEPIRICLDHGDLSLVLGELLQGNVVALFFSKQPDGNRSGVGLSTGSAHAIRAA
jgi:hypothetical protein